MKISIITVCYNACHCIEKAIKSVIDQRYPDIEYIIIDGASTDGTWEIINQYKNNIQKVISEKDNGIYDAMNKGASLSTGDVLYFLNADDRLFGKDVVSEIVQQFQNDAQIGIVYGKTEFTNVPINLNLDKNYIFEYKNRQQMLVQSNPQQCYFVRKSVFDRIGLFDTRYKICADYDWFLRAQNKHIRTKFIDKNVAFYDTQGRSFQRRYEVIGERIMVIFRNASLIEFLGYLIFASLRKIRDICVENFSSMNQEPLKHYFKNTSWLIAGRVIQALINFFIGVYVARFLGAENYGALSYVVSFVSLFSALATLGLDLVVVRDLVNSVFPRDALLGTAFSLRIIAAVITLGIIALIVSAMPMDQATKAMILIIAFGFLFQSFNIIDLYFQANVLSKMSILAQTVQAVFSALIKLAFIYFKAPLLWFAAAIVFDSLILAITMMMAYVNQNLSLRQWKFQFSIAKDLLKNSYPLIFSAIVVSLCLRFDQVMIEHMLGKAYLGNYATMVFFCEGWYMVPTLIITSFFPLIIRQKKFEGEKTYYLQKVYNYLIPTAVLVCLIVNVWGQKFFYWLYGPQFYQASLLIKVYIWSIIFGSMGIISERWLVNENLAFISFYRLLTGFLLNVILNLLLIPKFGLMGAAISAVMTHFWTGYLSDLFSIRTKLSFKIKTDSFMLFNLLRKN